MPAEVRVTLEVEEETQAGPVASASAADGNSVSGADVLRPSTPPPPSPVAAVSAAFKETRDAADVGNTSPLLSAGRVSDRASHLSSVSRSVCLVCCRSMPVTKAGLLRVHGPLGNRCAGSGMHVTSVDPFFGPASVRAVNRIPRSSRNLAATKLAAILVDVVVENNVESWSRLFNSSSRCLAVPRRGGHRRSLVTLINAQLREERDPLPSQFLRPSNQDCRSALARRVSSKLEDVNFRGAVRLTCSQDYLAAMNEETLTALRSKHPQRRSDSCIATGPHAATVLLFLADGVVIQDIRSFPRSLVGGPDALRPQHLVDLTSASAGGVGREVISALSSFLLHVLEGKKLKLVQPIFF